MEQETFSHTFPVADRARLNLGNIRGKVDIRSGESNVIRVAAVKHTDTGNSRQTEIRMEQESDGTVKVETRCDTVLGLFNWSKPCKVDYQVTVPYHTDLKLSLVSSSGTVEGLEGKLNLNTVSGDVRLSNITGPVKLNTVSGDVKTQQISGELVFDTVSGDLAFERADLPEIRGNGVSGNVYIETRLAEGPYKFHSVSGDVHLVLTEKAGCSIRTHSISGRLRTSLPANRTHYQGGSSSAELWGGGASIQFDSVSGDLKITYQGEIESEPVMDHTSEVAADEPLADQSDLENLQILEDIESGKITVEQGLALLSH